MTKPLDGRSAVITGASQGLGLAIAHAYVAAGASVLMCARDGALLERAREDVAAAACPDQHVIAYVADVSRTDEGGQIVARAIAAFGQLHILVNNAGVYGPLGAIDEIDWDATAGAGSGAR